MSYLGPKGTYSHEAALKCFSEDDLLPQEFLKDVVHSVYIGESEYGVLPIENSTNGCVYPALEALERCPTVKVHADLYVSVTHNLYTFDHHSYKRIYSHPQVWGQVEKFISQGKYELISCSSTVAALEQAKDDSEGAAIASEHGGKVMGIEPAQREINDEKGNKTRFVVLSLKEPKLGPTALVVGGTEGRIIDDELDIREVEVSDKPLEGRLIGYTGDLAR